MYWYVYIAFRKSPSICQICVYRQLYNILGTHEGIHSDGGTMGYISFWGWTLATVVVTAAFTYFKKLLKIWQEKGCFDKEWMINDESRTANISPLKHMYLEQFTSQIYKICFVIRWSIWGRGWAVDWWWSGSLMLL